MYPWIYTRSKEQPDDVALITDTERLTWSALYTKSHALASSWALLLSRGDRIALYGPSSSAYIIAIHAAQLLELTIVPINIRLSQTEVICQLNKRMFGSSSRIVSSIRRLNDFRFKSTRQAPDVLVRHMPKHYIQSMLFTSGTTGQPKAVEQTMLNHFSSAMNAARHTGSFPDDRFLVVTPFFHMSGLAVVYRSVIYGVPLILEPHFSPNKTITGSKRKPLLTSRLSLLCWIGYSKPDYAVTIYASS